MFGHTKMFGIIAALISMKAYLRYSTSIRAGKTDPSKAGWIVWLVVGFMIAFDLFQGKSGDGVIAPAMYALGTLWVFISTYQCSEATFEVQDWVSLAVAVFGFIWWLLWHDAIGSLYIEMAVDLFGGFMVAKHMYANPWKDDLGTWIFSFCGSVVYQFSIPEWSMANQTVIARWIYGPVLLVMCASLLMTLITRRRMVPHVVDDSAAYSL